MHGVIQENPSGVSYNVTDLENLRLSKLHGSMRTSAGEAYDAHIQIFMDLLDAQERMATIEPYWAGVVGDHNKRDAVAHLMNEAKRKRVEAQRTAAIRAAAKSLNEQEKASKAK